MRIETFQFHDRTTGWELEETKLDAFNLLVGVSGVGKTKILNAIRQIQDIALNGRAESACEWRICFAEGEDSYQWSAAIVDRGRRFEREEVIRNRTERLVERAADSFRFLGTSLPKLNTEVGALSLLASEPAVERIQAAFAKLVFAESGHPTARWDQSSLLFLVTLARHGKPSAPYSAATAVKGYVMREGAPSSWQEVKSTFINTFPSVEDVTVIRRPVAESDEDELLFAIKEKGTSSWIEGGEISSGMSRTLIHLIDIYLAPPGSVILIDEFENSLGKNCMPQLVDFILSRAPDLQFIITSHHPYIINNLPISTWKLVQRRGSRVKVLGAADIPELQRQSHFDAFDRLLNLPEFEEGIA